jgi:oligopeptidase B
MYLSRTHFALGLFAFLFHTALTQLDPKVAAPPVARPVPKAATVHGDTRVDSYGWLRDKSNPEAKAYLEAENAYTAAVMKPTAGLQEKLYSEMLGRIKQTDSSVPYRNGEYWYFSRSEQGKQYSILCRKHKSLDAAEEILLDLNVLAKGQPHCRLGDAEVSDDGKLLAYSIDFTGFRQHVLFVKNLQTGDLLPDRIEKVTSISWAADHRTIFYVTEDAAKRAYRLHRHTLGENHDELVFEEKDELYDITIDRSADKKYLFLTSASSRTTEVRRLPRHQPAGAWKVVLPRVENHEYYAEHRDGQFYLRTNQGAKNFRLVATPVDDPRPENWQELVPTRQGMKLEDVAVFAKHCVLSYQGLGLPEFVVLDLPSGKSRRIEFAEPMYALGFGENAEYETSTFRFHYESLVTPPEVFDYDMVSHGRKLLKRAEVRGYDPDKYTSERTYAIAKDGTRIPISLVYRKDARAHGPAPLLLYGYGAYGYSLPTEFDSQRLSLLDRGVVFAQAHIRGGGDLGEEWHEQGRMLQKRNSFTDFIDAADHLVAQKYTTPDRLGIEGGSAGGLLIGVVLNLRPDLCKLAVLQVPFVDALNTMLDPSVPLTAPEYLEWGNPNVEKEYEYIKSYCPYTNLAAKDYPAILVETSLHDSQVMYWEPAKYVAKLRATKTDGNVLVLKTNMTAGHGGASGRYEALRESAFTTAFILWELGIKE